MKKRYIPHLRKNLVFRTEAQHNLFDYLCTLTKGDIKVLDLPHVDAAKFGNSIDAFMVMYGEIYERRDYPSFYNSLCWEVPIFSWTSYFDPGSMKHKEYFLVRTENDFNVPRIMHAVKLEAYKNVKTLIITLKP